LESLQSDFDLEDLGFDQKAFDVLLDGLGEPEPLEVDDAGPEEPPEVPVSRTGELWILGDHRLLVGDSTNPLDIARVLGGEKACLWSSDPPYCVNYTGKDRPFHDGKPSGRDWSHVYREVDIEDLGAFLDKVFDASLPHLKEHTPIYCWHAHVRQPTIAAVFERHGLLLHQVLVWVKPSAVFGHSYYRWRHEPCAFGWVQGSKPEHEIGQLDTVWKADWDGNARFSTFHPTSKPTRLFEIPMEQHTGPGDVMLECFSGSGSQIIAGEKLRHRVCAIELQPAFVDGTIARWEKATGKQAVLDGGRAHFRRGAR
jgi:DNA modification methylase